MDKSIKSFNRNSKLAEWTQKVTDCRNSGMAVKDWCAQNEISTKAYYYWQRQVFKTAQEQAEIRQSEVTVTDVSFVEVNSAVPSQSAPKALPASTKKGLAMTIHSGEFKIDLYNDADPAILETVLRALRSC